MPFLKGMVKLQQLSNCIEYCLSVKPCGDHFSIFFDLPISARYLLMC